MAEAHARGDSDDESGIQIEDDYDQKDNSKQSGIDKTSEKEIVP